KDEKWKNLVNLKFADYIEKDYFLENILHETEHDENCSCGNSKIEIIYHFGACSSTQETDASYLMENNFEYTKMLVHYCHQKKIKFIYASSAATYGDGENSYSDKSITNLKPLNMYGYSKQLFDVYAEKKGFFNDSNFKIIGLKFFNVFGPNENHKSEMRSMVNKAFYQIQENGKAKLFKSYKKGFTDGEQKRDFIYVKDATQIVYKLANNNNIKSGIYNVGTGKASSWNELAKAIFKAMDKTPKIEYIEMPEILRGKYQYFTQADMEKTLSAIDGYKFCSLEDAVKDYVQNYLILNKYLGE
ncbi:MAG: ADP-glyceromanno-heptose 6-epimerase, partial [Elusimicrobiota bacterium]|nr:ADP-glyceromanno-heptose 6-epimerase [Elusimicrobiota bacterium]